MSSVRRFVPRFFARSGDLHTPGGRTTAVAAVATLLIAPSMTFAFPSLLHAPQFDRSVFSGESRLIASLAAAVADRQAASVDDADARCDSAACDADANDAATASERGPWEAAAPGTTAVDHATALEATFGTSVGDWASDAVTEFAATTADSSTDVASGVAGVNADDSDALALKAVFGTAVGDWAVEEASEADDEPDQAVAEEQSERAEENVADDAAAWGFLGSDSDKIGWITFEGALTDEPDSLAWLFGSTGPTFRQMLAKFDDAAERDDVSAIMLHFKDLAVDQAQINALNAAVDRVQAAGKKVHTFAEVYGPAELLIAAGADEIIIQENGLVSFPGLYTEEMYLGDMLTMFGLKADYVQVGDYKGASEQMTRSSPSREWSENIDMLLDDIWAQMKDTLQKGRGFSDQQFARILPELWALQSDRAIRLGVVDTELDILELKDHVRSQHDEASITQNLGPEEDSMSIDFNNPFALFSMLGRTPDHTPSRESIAVVHISGPIIDGESQAASFLSGPSVGSRTIRAALSEIENEDLIKGVVLRIDSPGGSALASEVIWQGVRRVAEKKPVHVSVGSMAASGGYYIAVSGDEIYVDPSSIVGSIGVVGGKIVMGNLFAKLNIGITPRTRGPRAGMASSTEPWSLEERELVRDLMTDTYALFARRVVSGRRGNIDMGAIAEGRLFTGRQAVKKGMADGIADLEATINQLAEVVGLEHGEYDVMNYPGPKSFEEMLEGMFGGTGLAMTPSGIFTTGGPMLNSMTLMPLAGSVATRDSVVPSGLAASGLGFGGLDPAGVRALAELLGPAAWSQVRDSLGAFLQLRDEPVLLMSPRVIIQKW